MVAHQVEYQDEYPVMRNFERPDTDHNTMLPFLRKSRDWAYEEEWRIVAPEEPNRHRAFDAKDLTGLLFGLRTTHKDKAYVRELMEERQPRYDLKPKIFQAVAAERACSMVIRKAP